jgi:hypothetical protein
MQTALATYKDEMDDVKWMIAALNLAHGNAL